MDFTLAVLEYFVASRPRNGSISRGVSCGAWLRLLPAPDAIGAGVSGLRHAYHSAFFTASSPSALRGQ